MIITNKYGMPPQLVRAVEKVMNSHPRFDENTFSVTELLKSPQQIALTRQHYNEIEIDVVDTYPMWHGLMIHKILEECADEEETIAEERLEFPLGNGLTLSGGFDALDKETWELYDYKTCKIAKYENNRDGLEQSWIDQLTMYAIMIEYRYGRRPKVAHIIAMLNDFSKVRGDIANGNGYPLHNVNRIDWNLNVPSTREDMEEENDFIAEFSDKAEVARAILRGEDSVENHPCTFGDCWCKEDYAVMKKGRKSAVRKFDNEAEARALYNELTKDGSKDYSIHHRVSEPTNCAHYCQCAGFCKQWQMMKGNELDEDITDRPMVEEMPF